MSNPSPNESVPFQTSDFYLACFLHARGYRLEGVKKSARNNRVTFMFTQLHPDHAPVMGSVGAGALVLGFYNGTENVPAFRFVAAIRELRGLLNNVPEEN